jgi:hypothetical protein
LIDAHMVPEWDDVIVIADCTPIDGSQGASRSDRSEYLARAQDLGDTKATDN